MLLLLNVLIYGLINSVILALMTLGFSVTFGVSRVANFAYGGFYLFGGYTTWLLLNHLRLPYPVAILLSIIMTGLLGALLYWAVLLRVRGMVLSEVIATFAIGVAILEFFRWAGFVTYEFNLPFFIKGGVEIGGVVVDYHRLIIVGIGLALFLFLWFFTHHTRIGLSFRAIAQEERTALTFGISSDWTAMLSVAFGSALATVAAIAVLPLGIISINVGYEVLLIVLAVSVLGGLESIWGAVAAGFILGYAQTITATLFAPEWMAVVYLAAILIVLIVRPSGILGKFKELEERV
ncbi:MAG: branched-chain amino acid ABC transporter permease [Candidatus Nezhaarchaeota archaeon]|nr:branched-chain amino acid ABC transporter permease [Candidatus Nezhaarchaeota archaeon]